MNTGMNRIGANIFSPRSSESITTSLAYPSPGWCRGTTARFTSHDRTIMTRIMTKMNVALFCPDRITNHSLWIVGDRGAFGEGFAQRRAAVTRSGRMAVGRVAPRPRGTAVCRGRGGLRRSVGHIHDRGVSDEEAPRQRGVRTSNSLPSGSARHVHGTSPWPRSMSVAPRARSRATSASWSSPG